MKIRTAHARRRRNFWRRKGHTHIRFNRGIWIRKEIVDPEGISMGQAQCTISGDEQPRAYRYYP